jgi:hypothetical protein
MAVRTGRAELSEAGGREVGSVAVIMEENIIH